MYDYSSSAPVQFQYSPIIAGDSLPLPNIIAPKDDGRNETFVQRQFWAAPALRIFSRWGQEVYSTRQYLNDWKGAGLPDGIYYYRFEGEQGRTTKGWLEVRR
jgi:gliding motility-associated-like protein